jgi:sugar-specific transcriptional regulator TrmB
MVVNSMIKVAVDKLKQVGFSEYEAKAYIALLRENPLTAYEIAKNSEIPTSKIYEVIRKLENRRTIQSIHGERSKMFIPLPPDEFIQNFRIEIDDKLHAVRDELKDIRTGIDMSYTWHIKDHEGLVLKAKRMLDTARENIILAIWPDEMKLLTGSLEEAASRNIKIAILHYGPTSKRIKQTYIHPVKETLFTEKGARGFGLVSDSREAINARITGRHTEAIWSMNGGFVVLTENYIRHEIYQMKIMKRFDPILRKEFGERYERLIDIY